MYLPTMLVGLFAATAMATSQASVSRMDPVDNEISKPTEARVSRMDPPEKAFSQPTQVANVLPPNVKAEDADPDDLINALKFDVYGFIHIADDGIARSYDSTGKVLDAVRLTNPQLKKTVSGGWAQARDHLDEVFAAVSGYDVEDNHLLNPPTHLLPVQFRSGKGYTNPELEASVAKAQAHIKAVIDMARPPNPLSRVKRALEKRQPLQCDELYCYLTYDCQLWGNADYDCGRCRLPDEMMTGQGRCDGPHRPAVLKNLNIQACSCYVWGCKSEETGAELDVVEGERKEESE